MLDCTGTVIQYEQRHEQQKEIIRELSEIWGNEGIKTMIFKGQANASFYPIPCHRATGDIDCFLFGEAERGDIIIKKAGAKVDNRWYRHSKIYFKGEMIENHRVMSHTRGEKKRKEIEDELRLMIQGQRLSILEECGNALMPTVQFNACFLTYHALHHFISEGLRLKHIVDWAAFLNSQQDNLDWKAYNEFCLRYKLDRFATVINYIAAEYLGVDINDSRNYDSVIVELVERVLRSTLYDDDYLFNSGKSDWMVRWILVKNMFSRDRWKYEEIMQQSVWNRLWLSGTGFVFKRYDD